MILDEQGKIVEKGKGLRGEGDWWEYVPTAEGKVAVEAAGFGGKCGEGGDQLVNTKYTNRPDAFSGKEHEDILLFHPCKATIPPFQRFSAGIVTLGAWQVKLA